jgi:hypothetical protein
MARVRYTAEEAKKLKGKTDWEKIDKMTDEELHQAALDDPDAQPLTEEQLAKFTGVVHQGAGVYGHDKSKSAKQATSKKYKG